MPPPSKPLLVPAVRSPSAMPRPPYRCYGTWRALARKADEALANQRLQDIEVGVAYLLGRFHGAAPGEDR
jgi:hypothetical protein